MNYGFLNQDVIPEVVLSRRVDKFEEKRKLLFKTVPTPRAKTPMYVEFENQKPTASDPGSKDVTGFEDFTCH